MLLAQSTPQPPNYGAGSAVQQTAPPATSATGGTPSEQKAPPVTVAAEPERPLGLAPAEKLFVREILVPEEDEEAHAALLRLVAPYLNRELTLVELNEVAAKVTRYYRNHGFIVARAYLPRQDASDGVLEIKVALGTYGGTAVKNNSLLRKSFVEGAFRHMEHESPAVTAHSLERVMLLVREMSGGAMPSVALEAGVAPGTTDLKVELGGGEHRFQGYLLGDNQGSSFTGQKRLFGALDVNSPLGIADKLSVSGMVSDGEKLHNLRFSYGLPLSYSGLRITVAASRTRYALGGSYSALDATGSVSAVDGTIAYPLMRRHDSNMDLTLNIAHRDLHDDLNAVSVFNPRTAVVGAATFQRTKFGTALGHRYYSTTGATVTVGEMNLANPAEIAATGTNGDYAKLVVNLSAETPLYRSLSARVSAVGQKDLRVKTLDSSEQLFVSGSGGVRAYAEGLSGDNGYIFNLELPYALPKVGHSGLQQSVSVFEDSGGVQAEKNNSSSTNFVLNDVGGGYTSTRSPFYFKIQGVRILGNIHSETSKTRLWLQLGFMF
jgi:hemolysin activation/secretion protein